MMDKNRNKILKVVKHPYFTFIAFGGILIALSLLQQQTSIIKYSFISALGVCLSYGIVAIGFSYLLGYAGLSSLGTAGFVGLGAYITVILLSRFPGLNFFLILILVLLIALILGVIVGFISLRIEGIFLAIVTLGLSEIIYQVFVNASDITGGTNGIKFKGDISLFPGINLGREESYLMIVVFLVILMVLTYNLLNSPTGRAMLAMKNSTSAAQAMGISLLKYRLLAFVLATLYAALGGALLVSFTKYTDPKGWTIMFSLNILAACLLGGSRNLWGILFGTFICFGLSPMFLNDVQYLRNNPWILSSIIGVILILVLLFYPGGMTQIVQELKGKIQGRKRGKARG